MHNKKRTVFLRILPIILIVIIAVLYILSGKTVTVDAILSFAPQNLYLAATVLIILYAAKSMSFIVPIMILYIAGGTIFPPFWAVIVNLIGTTVCIIIPYWVGYFSGTGFTEKLLNKYPKVGKVIEKQRKNDWFVSYMLRIISCLPCDVVSMYLGSIKIPFYKYLCGSLLGVFPGVIACTFMGASIKDVTSPVFIVSAAFTVLLSVGSFIVYIVLGKRKEKHS